MEIEIPDFFNVKTINTTRSTQRAQTFAKWCLWVQTLKPAFRLYWPERHQNLITGSLSPPVRPEENKFKKKRKKKFPLHKKTIQFNEFTPTYSTIYILIKPNWPSRWFQSWVPLLRLEPQSLLHQPDIWALEQTPGRFPPAGKMKRCQKQRWQ